MKVHDVVTTGIPDADMVTGTAAPAETTDGGDAMMVGGIAGGMTVVAATMEPPEVIGIEVDAEVAYAVLVVIVGAADGAVVVVGCCCSVDVVTQELWSSLGGSFP